MPFVIPRSRTLQCIPSEEVLEEISGHGDFDGEDWAYGDRIFFEDGTESRIKPAPGGQFHARLH
ncbi:MAG: hypothetical protein KDA75_13115 [Planctomycetaceae bacterium]|nr:hypothetical protein [Planctomycetaceae bacterium]